MAKYKKDSNRVLTEDTRFVIPHNNEVGETVTVTAASFSKGDDYGFVKQELIKVLKALGLNRQQAKLYIKEAFPGVY
jgi:hypothetical protein